LPERRCGVSRKERLRQFRDLIHAFGDNARGIKTVYHYTSAESLRGIIENGELWLTNTRFVNDITECRALWQRENLFREGELTNSFVQESWDSRIRKCEERGLSASREDAVLYIASFSKAKDSLEQWRAYGGFCIGFDVSKMICRRFTQCKCVYKESEIHDWIIEKSTLDEWRGDCLNDQTKRMAARALLDLASKKYKSSHYKSEREVRITAYSNHTWGFYANSPGLFVKDPPIHFRKHRAYKVPVPYVKFFVPFADTEPKSAEGIQGEAPVEVKRRKLKEEAEMSRELLPITEVWIGPMAHQEQEQAKLACEIMLCERGYENVPVIASKIPYRGG
jgi:hypothetical protein